MVASDAPERHGEVWWPYHPPTDINRWQIKLIERRSLFDGGELIAGLREDQIERALTSLVLGVPNSLPIHDDLLDWRRWLLDASAHLKHADPLLAQRKSNWIRHDQALIDIGRVAAALRAGDATIPARIERHYAELEDIDREARTYYARLDEYRRQWLRFATSAEAWFDDDWPPHNRGSSNDPDWLAQATADVGLLKNVTEILRQRSDTRGSLSADVAAYNESRRHWRFAILLGQ